MSEAERKVKAAWPDLRCLYYPKDGRFKICVGRLRIRILGTGFSVSEAWLDAAERLEMKEQQ